jgi:predicted small secreted protein
MLHFKSIQNDNNLKEVIKSAFDMDLSVTGSWGYTLEESTIIENGGRTPIEELEYTIASMRTYIEMNMTLPKEERFASINLTEIQRKEIKKNNLTYHEVTYSINAMKEELYASFIDEYKECFGKEDFDLALHFKKRKEAAITREIKYYFELSKTL